MFENYRVAFANKTAFLQRTFKQWPTNVQSLSYVNIWCNFNNKYNQKFNEA